MRNAEEGRPFYIIDGYNVVFSGGFERGKGDIEASREQFVRFLDGYASRKKVEILVVWDGKEGCASGASGGSAGSGLARSRVMSVYTASGIRADEKIVQLVERMRRRGRVTVVSDDRRHITAAVRSLGANTMGTRSFLDLVHGRGKVRARTDEIRSKNETGTRRKIGGRPTRDEYGADFIRREKVAADDLSVEDWLKMFQSGRKKG